MSGTIIAGMTSRQIAEAVGKPERTVRDWVKATSAKSANVQAKSANALATKKPAVYTLAESCLIIEEGLGKAAADVYRTNAVNATMAAAPKPARLSASLIRECRISVEHGVLSRAQIAALLGVPAEPAALAPLQIPAAAPPVPGSITPKLSAKYLERKRKFTYKLGSDTRICDIAATFGVSLTDIRAIARRLKIGEIANKGQAFAILDTIEREIPV